MVLLAIKAFFSLGQNSEFLTWLPFFWSLNFLFYSSVYHCWYHLALIFFLLSFFFLPPLISFNLSTYCTLGFSVICYWSFLKLFQYISWFFSIRVVPNLKRFFLKIHFKFFYKLFVLVFQGRSRCCNAQLTPPRPGRTLDLPSLGSS